MIRHFVEINGLTASRPLSRARAIAAAADAIAARPDAVVRVIRADAHNPWAPAAAVAIARPGEALALV
jgi:hypothetical protein